MIDSSLIRQEHSYPLLFATVTGSHAFGCSSPYSDYDVHGVHLLPVQEVLGLGCPHETIERKMENPADGLEVDIATHDLKKFVWLLLKGNGNVLEDLYSPLVLTTSSVHDELKELGKGCITKQLAHHYKGYAYNQQRRMKANELKKYLHLYRGLLMGTYLMRTGKLEMSLPWLADEYALPIIHRLIAQKQQGFDFIPDDEAEDHMKYVEMLRGALEQAREESQLPDRSTEMTRSALEQLVIRVRLEGR
jgi:predicted nucleotidyltransferase